MGCRWDGAVLQLILGLSLGWAGVPKELAGLGCADPCASSWLPSVQWLREGGKAATSPSRFFLHWR